MEPKEIFIAVGAVIEDGKGRILLVKHVPQKRGFWQGKWICPGGRLRFGEAIQEGIKREVWEETHLEITLTTPLIPFERIVEVEGKTTIHVIYIDYLAKLAAGQFRPGSDVGKGIWVHKEDLPRIWDELHEDTKRLLQIAKM